MGYDEWVGRLNMRVARGGQFVRNLDAALSNAAQPGYGPQGSYGTPNSGGSQSGGPITDYAVVTLDGSGNGTARISPGQVAPGGGVGMGRNSGYSWDISGVNSSVATNAKEATATTYVSQGIMSTGTNDIVGQTQTGSTGDTCTVSQNLRPGDWITTAWTGGDPGSTATMKIIGTVNISG
jgi:hypothetical protein